jgi:hypothetical protein
MLCSTSSRSNEEPERRVPRVIRQVEATLKEPDKIAPLPTARICGIGLPVCICEERSRHQVKHSFTVTRS